MKEILFNITVFLLLTTTDCSFVKKINITRFEDESELSFLSAKTITTKTVLSPFNLTLTLEKYLGKWTTEGENSYFYFKPPEPILRGSIPGVVMSDVQANKTDLNKLFDEAEEIQTKAKDMILFYRDTVLNISKTMLEIQRPRFDFLQRSDLNESEYNKTILNDFDVDLINVIAQGALEVEVIVNGYRFLMRKLNYYIKKIVCAREGERLFTEGYRNFIMIYAETILTDASAKNLLSWAINDGYGSCQFVGFTNNFQNDIYETLTRVKTKVTLIAGEK